MRRSEILVFIPTYNEYENVGKICLQILALRCDLDIMFMDDNSDDGTGAILKKLVKEYPNVHVIFRPRKLGVGSAHLDGIRWAYDQGYKKLITMDCDFTHSPGCLPDLIGRYDDYDMVIGSRYLLRNSLPGWNPLRKFLTHAGHFITKCFLGIKYDATGALRLYRLDRIPRQVFDLIHSTGYSFFFESLYILQINNFHIIEFPIVLSARTYGHSKMRIEDVFHSVQRLAELYTKAVVMNKRHLLMFQSSGAREQTALFSIREWDEYWKKKSSATGSLYDAFSAFYRKVIIRRQLNYFIKKHFTLGGSLLHAGCGSGQVDTDINRKYSITALDVSPHALELYRKFNRDNPRVVRGDIFCLSFKDDTFDGAYNLGVLEHFTEEDIMRILAELRRVIKPGGKILVFWPPEFGLSVRVLKMIRVVSRAILRREIKLHPDEVTLAKSRAHIETIGVKANLKVVDYYFGLRDCFTQIAVVFSKSIDTHSGQEHRQ